MPKPAEMTNEAFPSFARFFKVRVNATAVPLTTASPPLLTRLREERSTFPKRSVRFSKSRVSLASKKLGANETSMDCVQGKPQSDRYIISGHNTSQTSSSIKRRCRNGSERIADAWTCSCEAPYKSDAHLERSSDVIKPDPCIYC